MSIVKVEEGEIQQLVSCFKSEGTFDKLRRQIFSTITSTVMSVESGLLQDSFNNVASAAENAVDELLKSPEPDLNKNKARDILRKKLFSCFWPQYGLMIAKGLDADETLSNMLEDIGQYVDSFLGLTETKLIPNCPTKQPSEDHEVCDMEIESDSCQSPHMTSATEIPLSDIALPPTHQVLTASTFPYAAPSSESSLPASLKRTYSMANAGYTKSTNGIMPASKSMFIQSGNVPAKASFDNYQILSKKFCGNSRTALPYNYIKPAVRSQISQRPRACNDNFFYYY